MKKIFSLALALTLMASCSKFEMLNFSETQPFVNFVKGAYYPRTVNLIDSMYICTLYAYGEDQMTIDLPVIMSGAITQEDRTFKIAVSQEGSRDLVRGKHYVVSDDQVIKGGSNTDTIKLVLNVSEIEKDQIHDGRLKLEIVTNDNFSKGIELYSYVVINVYGEHFPDFPSPTFWVLNKMDEYAGTYTSGKAGEFVKMHGIKDDDWYAPNKAILYEMARSTYLYLESNNILDKNGNRIRFNGTIKF